jgi:hypothetical protein
MPHDHSAAGLELVQAAISEAPGGSILSALIDTIPAVQERKAASALSEVLEFLDRPDQRVSSLRQFDPIGESAGCSGTRPMLPHERRSTPRSKP